MQPYPSLEYTFFLAIILDFQTASWKIEIKEAVLSAWAYQMIHAGPVSEKHSDFCNKGVLLQQ